MQAPGKLGRGPVRGGRRDEPGLCWLVHAARLPVVPSRGTVHLTVLSVCEDGSVSVSAVQRLPRQSSRAAARGDGLACLLASADWLRRAGLAQGARPASGPRPSGCLSGVCLELSPFCSFTSFLS